MLNLKTDKMKKLTTRQLKKIVKKEHPNAINVKLGSNGIVSGIWFDKGKNAKLRTFIPS